MGKTGQQRWRKMITALWKSAGQSGKVEPVHWAVRGVINRAQVITKKRCQAALRMLSLGPAKSRRMQYELWRTGPFLAPATLRICIAAVQYFGLSLRRSRGAMQWMHFVWLLP